MAKPARPLSASTGRSHGVAACLRSTCTWEASQIRPPGVPQSRPPSATRAARRLSVRAPIPAKTVQLQSSRPSSARVGSFPAAQIAPRMSRGVLRPQSAGSAYAYARAGGANGGQTLPSIGDVLIDWEAVRDGVVLECFSLSLILDLPDELLTRSCGNLLAYELRGMLETCRMLREATEKVAVQLLSKVHALERRRRVAHAVPLLRQLHIVECMTALVKPSMSVFRQAVILAIGSCHRGPPLDWPACNEWPLPHDVLLSNVAAAAVSVACGRRHALFLDQVGHAWAVGDPRAGGVQEEGKGELLRPALVTALSRIRLMKVACGNGHTVAMSVTGDVFTWGRVLGEMAVTDDASEWQLPDVSRGLAGEAVDVAAGEAHAAAASLTGDTYVWGQNHHGQCARDPSAKCEEDCRSSDTASCLLRPARAGGALTTAVARRVACGKYHTVVLSVDGAAYSFGASLSGQLGRTSNWSTDPPWRPAPVFFNEVAGESRCGQMHTGSDICTTSERRPGEAQCNSSTDVRIVQVACGDEHTLCLTDAGKAYAFGSGSHGQLGLGTVRCHRAPVVVRLGKICELAAGLNWSLFRDCSGKVFQAGRDEEDVDDCRLLRQVSG